MPKSTTSPQFDSKLEPANDRASSMKRPGERSAFEELLRWLTRSLAILAVLSSVALLCIGATPMLSSLPAAIATQASLSWELLKNVPLSALPLLLAGISYLVLQVIVRPRPLELFKRVMLAAAFLLWGIVQLMPRRQSRLRTGKSGDRALRDRSRPDHLDRPGEESSAARRQRLTFLSRSALVITDTELKLIAALAIIGLSSKPNAG